MKDLKVGQMLMGAFALLILVMATLSAVSISRLAELDDHVEQLANDRVPKLVTLNRWMSALLNSARHTRNILIYDKEKIPEEIAAIHKDAEIRHASFAFFNENAKSESSRAAIAKIDAVRQQYVKAENELIRFAESDRHTEIKGLLVDTIRPLQLQYIAELQSLIDYQVAQSKQQSELSAATYRRSLQLQLLTSGGAIVLAIVLAIVITRRLTGQLGGEPAYAAAVARSIAAGDLTAAITVQPGDKESLIYSLKSMQESLHSLIGRVSQAARAVAGSAHGLSAASSQVAIGSSQQSDAAGSMAAAVEELTVSISHVTSSASNAHELASDAGDSSRQGAVLVQESVAEINKISRSVERSADEVRHLGEQSEKISGIVHVIKDIADQTNLLALNAAIEAARAGEQGRGFAVVADEVRKLAERTSLSTQEISAMISEIQGGTDIAVRGMSEGIEQVRHGVEIAEKSGESMRLIESGAFQLLDAVDDISRALQEQSGASNQIASNVERIAQMAEENNSAIQTVAESARHLEQLADALQRDIDYFRV